MRLFSVTSLVLALFFSSIVRANEARTSHGADDTQTVREGNNCVDALSPGEIPLPRSNRLSRLTDFEKQKRSAFASIQAFKNYFESVNKIVLERKDVVDILELALIAQEFVLMKGPPGNAKSQLSDLVFGNILDENGVPSYYRIQMTPETTMSETHGPMNIKKLMKSSIYERHVEEGMLLAHNIFIDEIFDARQNAMRNLLGILAERSHSQGRHITKGNIQSGAAATNKYIGEVYERAGNDDPKAVLDRFAFTVFIPGEFELTESYVKLIQGAKKKAGALPVLTLADLDAVRALVPTVEVPESVAKTLAVLASRIKAETEALEQSSLNTYNDKKRTGEDPGVPYRATKYHSPRTIAKAGGVLKAYVVREWIKSNGKRKLVANIEDLKILEKFFGLNSAGDAFVKDMFDRSTNPFERAQLSAVLQEREIFKRHYEKLLEEIQATTVNFALDTVAQKIATVRTEEEKRVFANEILAKLLSIETESVQYSRHSQVGGAELAFDYVKDFLIAALKDLLPNYSSEKVREELAKTKQRIAEEFQRKQEEARLAELARLAEVKRLEDLENARQQKIKEESERLKGQFANLTKTLSVYFNSDFTKGAIGYNESKGLVAVFDGVKTIHLYDVATKEAKSIDTPEVPSSSNQLSITDSGKIILIPGSAHQALVVDSITMEQNIIPISFGGTSSPPIVNTKKDQIIFHQSGHLTQIDLSGKKVFSEPFQWISGNPVPIGFSSDGNYLFFNNTGDAHVNRLDLLNTSLHEFKNDSRSSNDSAYPYVNGLSRVYHVFNSEGVWRVATVKEEVGQAPSVRWLSSHYKTTISAAPFFDRSGDIGIFPSGVTLFVYAADNPDPIARIHTEHNMNAGVLLPGGSIFAWTSYGLAIYEARK